jgi:signal transduction histidine kinase
MARLEAGIIEPRPEPTPAASLFASAREGLAAILGERRVEVHVDDACPDLFVDPGLALEVVVNLLENAARAAPADTDLNLVASPDPEDASRVRVEVLDRGPGVPPAASRALADRAEWRGSGGDVGPPGLGLPIAAGLARACDGTLTLLPRPGGGTIARFVVPAALSPALAERTP